MTKTNELVSYEVALLARDMGFKEPCEYFAFVQPAGLPNLFVVGKGFLSQHNNGGQIVKTSNHENLKGIVTVPTKEQLLAWLKEAHIVVRKIDTLVYMGLVDRIKNETFDTEAR